MTHRQWFIQEDRKAAGSQRTQQLQRVGMIREGSMGEVRLDEPSKNGRNFVCRGW